jgi:hypothetical protein
MRKYVYVSAGRLALKKKSIYCVSHLSVSMKKLIHMILWLTTGIRKDLCWFRPKRRHKTLSPTQRESRVEPSPSTISVLWSHLCESDLSCLSKVHLKINNFSPKVWKSPEQRRLLFAGWSAILSLRHRLFVVPLKNCWIITQKFRHKMYFLTTFPFGNIEFCSRKARSRVHFARKNNFSSQ